MQKLYRGALAAVVVALLALSLPAPSVEAIADPTTPPRLDSVYVYDLDDGGLGIIAEYFLDYTAPFPAETAAESYLVSFIDTDGVTIRRSVAPYVFVDSGYGRGVVWIRFTAAEVATYSFDSANEALHTLVISGNPTVPSGWAGDPPAVPVGITDWITTGDIPTLLALRVLDYAAILTTEWSIDLREATALGNRLTTAGAQYFENAIPGLRVLAPNAFSASETVPDLEDLDYSTTFSALAESGTATVVGDPQTLVVGANTVDTGATVGTMTITLSPVARGSIADGTGTFVGVSPATLVSGVNTITVDGAGTFTVTLTQNDLQAQIDTGTSGTPFDMTDTATVFGMSAGILSTAIWLLLGIILVGASYGAARKNGISGFGDTSAGKTSMFLYGLWLIFGVLIGIVLAKIMAFLFIGYGAFIGYIMFYRSAGGDTGRNVTFMGWMWIVVVLAGGLLQGLVPQASTHLTADLTAAATTINVASTEGFRSTGIVVINNERIAYADTTATTLVGTTFRPLLRGVGGTEAAAHSSGATVRMPESALLNDSMSFNIAQIADSAGLMSFLTVPFAIWNIITGFLFLPLSFLGTDMVLLTVIWGVVALGTVVSFFVSMAGGRRV